MIVECPKCKKRYRVKDELVPVGGGPVRCPSCGNIFTIYREPLNIPLEPIEEARPTAPPKPEVPRVAPAAGPAPAPKPAAPTPPPAAKPAPPPTPTPAPGAAKPGAPQVESPAERLARLFGRAEDEFPPDWDEETKRKHREAKRLARSLARDILLYHRDKVERGLKEGNLPELIGEEIRKSWEFYKQKVPPDILQSTTYFKDALNEILGKGKKIFV